MPLLVISVRFVCVAVTCVALALPVPNLPAQSVGLPPDTLLRGIEARGRALAAYDRAAWHGSDAVVALRPARRLITHYVARPTAFLLPRFSHR
jgi:hypothetical protein